MVAHTCNPSNGRLRQENQELDQPGLYSKNLSQNNNLLKIYMHTALIQQPYFREFIFGNEIAISKPESGRVFIGALFVVAKVMKQTEWSNAQIRKGMGSTWVDLKGSSGFTC